MKHVIIIVLGTLLISSCAKKKDSSSSNLNSAESSLIGTWHVTKEEVHYPANPDLDTTLTGYGTDVFITFKSNQFGSTSAGGGSNWKEYQGSWVPNVPTYPGTAAASITDYWYANSNLLNVVVYQATIMSNSGSDLVVKGSAGSIEVTSYLHKG